MEKIKTSLSCPLCYSEVEIGIRERGYWGHCENREEVPDGATITAVRKVGKKNRYHYRFPGYVPMCSNKACFLHGLTRQFKSKEDAEKAWTERARPWYNGQ